MRFESLITVRTSENVMGLLRFSVQEVKIWGILFKKKESLLLPGGMCLKQRIGQLVFG